MKSKSVVVAVGGNALIKDKDHTSIRDQYEAVQETVKPIVALLNDGWRVVITHGNGPQVGYILRRSELSVPTVPPVPMDYAGADIQGAVGYMFNKALRNELHGVPNAPEIAALVTEVVMDRNDPAFDSPSKPIGSHMAKEDAQAKAGQYGWQIAEDAGRGWRRVVASPQPVEIVELPLIKLLNDQGYVVVCAGGGGIPVIRDESGRLVGVEAVIDKDHASSLLASELGVDLFAIVTAVDRVAIGFNTDREQWLERLTISDAEKHLANGEFHKGSMEPKVTAMVRYLKRSGNDGIITSLSALPEALRGLAGTRFTA